MAHELNLGQGPGCLEPVDHERVASGLGTPSQVRHLNECNACQTELALLREFVDGQPSTAEEAAAVTRIERQLRQSPPWAKVAEPRRRWFAAWNWQLAGFALAGALVLVLFLMPTGGPRQPGLAPLDGGASVLRAGEVTGLAPVGDVEAAPDKLRWQPAAGATQYRVQILDVEELPVWSAMAAPGQVELALPAEARALMLPHKTLFWKVEALDRQGQVLASSALERFRVIGQQGR